MRAIITGLALLALAGCATMDAPPAGPAPVADTIRFSAGPCFGACPSYAVIVEPDGSAVLLPERNTSVPGETRFTVTPDQYRRLRASFAPFRPPTGAQKHIVPGEKGCARVATDHSSYSVLWTRTGLPKTQLNFYGGCHDPQNARLRAAVAAVPRLLDIEKMLKAGQ